MKPTPFEYVCPGSTDEALAALGEHGDEAKVLAGGQSLVPLMNLRLARPEVLIDINRIAELAEIDTTDGLRVGAIARQADVEASPGAARVAPLVVEALGHVAHPQLRNRGTVVGSIAHHDPVAELPMVAVALDAEVTLAGRGGARTVAADGFFTGVFSTAAAPDELLTHVRFPELPSGTNAGFSEFARRRGDFAVIAATATLRIEEGVVASASVALAGAADRPVRCRQTEASLVGQPAVEATWQEAGASAVREDGVDPRSDRQGSAEFRRALLAAAVADACSRAAAA